MNSLKECWMEKKIKKKYFIHTLNGFRIKLEKILKNFSKNDAFYFYFIFD